MRCRYRSPKSISFSLLFFSLFIFPLSFSLNKQTTHFLSEKVLKEENLVENSAKMGEVFRKSMAEAQKQHSWIVGNRGKGLFNAIGLLLFFFPLLLFSLVLFSKASFLFFQRFSPFPNIEKK